MDPEPSMYEQTYFLENLDKMILARFSFNLLDNTKVFNQLLFVSILLYLLFNERERERERENIQHNRA